MRACSIACTDCYRDRLALPISQPLMRALSFRSNVLFIIAACAGLIASLGRAWYAPAAAPTVQQTGIGDVNGPIDGFFTHLQREFTSADGTTGWVVFATTDTLLCGLAALAVVTALATMFPSAEMIARELLRAVTLAMLGVVVVKLAHIPDAPALAERRQGAWIALFATGIAASSAFTLANAPIRRNHAGRSLYDSPSTPAPAPISTINSAAPPGSRSAR